MIYYKNTSCSVKTFHGVSFNPGEVKAVPDFINQKYMIRVDNPIQQKPSSDAPKKSEDQNAEKKASNADSAKKPSTSESSSEPRK